MTTETRATAAEQAEANKTQLGVGARELVVLISSVMALMAVGLDLVLPGFDEIRDAFDLGEGSNRTGQIITFYFFGMAAAQLVWGPLADRYGRKPVLYAGITIYMIGAAASALAPSFEALLGARVIWGVGAAGARVVATAIIRDRFVGERMAKAMSQIMAVFVLVPIVAPSFGALILAVAPWQAVFWFCVGWAAIIAIWSLRLRETLDPAHVRPLSVGQVGRSYLEVARIPVTVAYTFASVCLQVVFTLYLASSELIISEIFDRGDQFPIVFGVIAIGFGVSAVINSRLVERYGIPSMVRAALIAATVGSALLVAIAMAGGGQPSFWIFMPVTGFTLSTFMLMMPNMNTAAMTPVGHIAGAASAFTSAIRIGVGAAIAGVLNSLIEDSVTPFAVVMLAMVLIASLIVAWVRTQPETQSATP